MNVKKKSLYALIFFILVLAYITFVIVKESSKTGCIYVIQEAKPLFKDIPPGVPFTISDIPYKCTWNPGGILLLCVGIGVGLIVVSKSKQK